MPAPKVSTNDYSQNIGTTAVQIFAPGFLTAGLSHMRIWNVAPTGGGTVWLSRNGSHTAANTAGSYPLAPGQYELFTVPQAIPRNPLSAVATAANTPLTLEVG